MKYFFKTSLMSMECQRPYHLKYTGSRQLPAVKLRRASSVRGWVTASEYGVLLTFMLLFSLSFQ